MDYSTGSLVLWFPAGFDPGEHQKELRERMKSWYLYSPKSLTTVGSPGALSTQSPCSYKGFCFTQILWLLVLVSTPSPYSLGSRGDRVLTIPECRKYLLNFPLPCSIFGRGQIFKEPSLDVLSHQNPHRYTGKTKNNHGFGGNPTAFEPEPHL